MGPVGSLIIGESRPRGSGGMPPETITHYSMSKGIFDDNYFESLGAMRSVFFPRKEAKALVLLRRKPWARLAH
jgi:hypothetical protein